MVLRRDRRRATGYVMPEYTPLQLRDAVIFQLIGTTEHPSRAVLLGIVDEAALLVLTDSQRRLIVLPAGDPYDPAWMTRRRLDALIEQAPDVLVSWPRRTVHVLLVGGDDREYNTLARTPR